MSPGDKSTDKSNDKPGDKLASSERLLELVSKLAEAHDVLPFYWDIRGVQQYPLPTSKIAALQAFGIDTASAQSMKEALQSLEHADATRIIEPVLLKKGVSDFSFEFKLPENFGDRALELCISLEEGGAIEQRRSVKSLEVFQRSEYAAERFVHYRWALPISFSFGYYDLTLRLVEQNDHAEALAESRLIVYPERAFGFKDGLKNLSPAWGLQCQLYGLRSGRNWGVGDWRDLSELIARSTPFSPAFIGLNPLHWLASRAGSEISPYAPSSRVSLQSLYLDLEGAAILLEDQTSLSVIQSQEFQAKVQALRESEFVAYQEVAKVKFDVLEMLFKEFDRRHVAEDSARAKEFRRYVSEEGVRLRSIATFAVLEEHCTDNFSKHLCWWEWPPEYRRPSPELFESVERKFSKRLRFYEFVEWLSHAQISAVQLFADAQQFPLGLYLDLALGARASGADCWRYQDLYAFKASMGAPPDALGPSGQSWGLPPYLPRKLREAKLAPWIEVLRYVMRYGGVLRIDHVMSLCRLYWVPEGCSAKEGLYVRYPLDELMAVLVLESQRNSCLVIGEDLGTVPTEVEVAMRESGIFSYKVLYFMKSYESSELQPFLGGSSYQREALVVTSTHDLPSFSGFWSGHDLAVRQNLKLHEPAIMEALSAERSNDKRELLVILKSLGLLPDASEGQDFDTLRDATHIFLAQTDALLQAVQLEDLAKDIDQANLPGTVDEHPNWRRKLGVPIDRLLRDESIKTLLNQVKLLRGVTTS